MQLCYSFYHSHNVFDKYQYLIKAVCKDCSVRSDYGNHHCVKSIQIRSYFWSVFFCNRTEYEIYSVNLCIQSETGKYGPEITPYLDTFHAVHHIDVQKETSCVVQTKTVQRKNKMVRFTNIELKQLDQFNQIQSILQVSLLQKQPFRGVLMKRCSENMQQIYRRTANAKITLRHGCSPVNSQHIFRTPFLKNISGWLLLLFNNLVKGVCFLRDNKTVIGCGDDGYQIYSVQQSNIQPVAYCLSRLNKF